MDVCHQEAIVRSGTLLAIVTRKNENVVRFKIVRCLQESLLTFPSYLLNLLQINKTSMDDILGQLPPELLKIVLSFLLPLHIKNLRLVNRKYHDASSHLLMRRVYFALRPKTLAVFNEIIEHPIFCRSVTEIVYDTSLFIDQRNRRPGDVGHFIRCLPCAGLYSQEVIDAADREYRWLFFQQERIRDNSEDLAALHRASQTLVSLSSLVYTDWMILNDSYRFFSGTLIAETRESNCWYLRDGPMSWDVKKGCLPMALQINPSGKITHLLRNICGFDGSNLTIRELTFAIQDINRSFMRLAHQMCSPSSLASTENLMGNLYKLSITIAVSGKHVRHLPQISRTIALAKRLFSLKLVLETRTDSAGPSKEWRLLLPNYWPQLRRLDLSGFWYLNTSDLLDFLGRHAATIRHLALSDMYIEGGSEDTWIDFALQLQMALPRLNSLILRKLSEAGDDEFKHLIDPYEEGSDILGVLELTGSLDCAFRSKHLRLLEEWILSAHGLPITEKMTLRQKVEDLRCPQGWHDFTQMGTF